MRGNIVDRVAAVLALAAVSPALVVVACAVWMRMGRPVLFRQTRIGHRGRAFTLLKFRTMTEERDEQGELLPDGLRLTGLGRWLRSWSLDELPQLWNVARGEMKFVGPRPLLERYLPRYSEEQRRRHEVPPGITGWAQVNGRNEQSWEERLRMDVWYVDHRSRWLDAKIVCRTVSMVIRREGLLHPGDATMPEFRGEGRIAQTYD